MTFRLTEKYRKEWESHLSPEVRARMADPKPVSLKEWEAFRGNSWEQYEIRKKLGNEALIHAAEYCLKNCNPDRRKPAIHYDAAFLTEYGPMLIERLKVACDGSVTGCPYFTP